MASFNKFNCFVEDLAEGSQVLSSDTLMALLTNTSPNAADVLVDTTQTPCVVGSTSNAVEVAAASGYVKKGAALDLSSSAQSGGVYKLILTDEVITAGADIGPFRYIVLYNDTKKTTATRPPIGWYDYASSITLHNGETFTLDFDGTNGVLSIT
jgi:hypothetical protein